MRKCRWLGISPAGRPYCSHGPAVSNGPKWKCRDANRRARLKYRATAKGREHRRRENATAHARSSKAIYRLTSVDLGVGRLS